MAYVDQTAIDYVCRTADVANKELRPSKDILSKIIEEINKQHKETEGDFRGLWDNVIKLYFQASLDLFEADVYPSAIGRYYALRKAAQTASSVKASKLTVEKLQTHQMSMYARIQINSAISIHFRALQGKQFGKLKDRNVELDYWVRRAHLSGEIPEKLIESARRKARAEMNKYRK